MSRYHSGLERQASQLYQSILHCACFFRSTFYHSTWTSLLLFQSHLSAVYLFIIMTLTHLVLQGLRIPAASPDCEDPGWSLGFSPTWATWHHVGMWISSASASSWWCLGKEKIYWSVLHASVLLWITKSGKSVENHTNNKYCEYFLWLS